MGVESIRPEMLGAVMAALTSCRKHGFSLLEMLAVVGAVAILLSMVVVITANRDNPEIARAAMRDLRSSLAAVRQEALSRNVPARFAYGNIVPEGGRWNRGFHAVFSSGYLVGSTQFITRGVCFAETSGEVWFGADGRGMASSQSWSNGVHEIALVRSDATNIPVGRVRVYGLTGAVGVTR